MINWNEIKKEWETTKITLAALAEKYDIKLGTLKSRKSREAWTRGAPKKDATKKKKDATISKRMQPIKELKEPVVESNELTEKQRLFCIYYIKYFNATKAYQKAYECAYSTAMTNGHGLLRNTKLSKEIDRMKAEQANELKLDLRDVLQKYIDIAFADVTDYLKFGREEEIVYNEHGEPELDANSNVKTQAFNYIHLNDSTEIDGTILTEVKQGRDGITVKLADKMKALDKLSLYFDLFPDKFQREVEEEKLKIAHHKAFGANESEKYEDDGFNEALNAATSEVWDNANNTEED